MAKLDTYYRAFKEYRKETKNDAECRKERKDIASSNLESDSLISRKNLCTIESDWVIAIEEGLEYIEKALQEERQFIRVNGEIVKIEKVKKVSKTSVEHLARHANLITHLPSDESSDIIPDELYITEKLNDYAVYENRFLYMLLKYLEQYIDFRINEIEKARATYKGNFAINKLVTMKNRTLEISMTINEERNDNPYPLTDRETDDMIKRIKDCALIVDSLLLTPLMVEVSKTPMLKPPITKTNVLKMNNNFKKALALYEYISEHNDLGFTKKEITKNYMPFNESNADELVDSLSLTSFLTYKIGNDINDVLETSYVIEERKRREEEIKKLDERINRLKKKALESGKTLEEYMLLLETRVQQLLKDSEDLALARNEIDKLNQKIVNLNLEIIELNRRIAELNDIIAEKLKEIERLNQKYIDDMTALKAKHEMEIHELIKEHDIELLNQENDFNMKISDLNEANEKIILKLKEDQSAEIKAITSRYESEISAKEKSYILERTNLINNYEENILKLNTSHKEEVNTLQERLKKVTQDLNDVTINRKQKIKEFEEKIKTLTANYEHLLEIKSSEIDALNKKNSDLVDEANFHKGELSALRIKEGIISPSDDFSTKERFQELTKELEAMEKFMDAQWKLTRKKIKKEAKEEHERALEEERIRKEEIISEYEAAHNIKNDDEEELSMVNNDSKLNPRKQVSNLDETLDEKDNYEDDNDFDDRTEDTSINNSDQNYDNDSFDDDIVQEEYAKEELDEDEYSFDDDDIEEETFEKEELDTEDE